MEFHRGKRYTVSMLLIFMILPYNNLSVETIKLWIYADQFMINKKGNTVYFDFIIHQTNKHTLI